jgi:hypothetical protein
LLPVELGHMVFGEGGPRCRCGHQAVSRPIHRCRHWRSFLVCPSRSCCISVPSG